jgi:hypothetical protein
MIDQQSGEIFLWDRLANLLHTEEGCEIAMLMQQCGLLKSESSTNLIDRLKQKAASTVEPRAIGPWVPRNIGSELEFVRENKWDKYLWLEERDILKPDKKEGTYRVCLVGESVAAGMFFSPNISPAKVLNSILDQTISDTINYVEVIDFSRNAMRIELLVDVVDAASQLNPDVIVVFAGNNFCRDHTIGRADQSNISKTLIDIATQQGPIGLVKHFTDELALATHAAIDVLVANAVRNASEILWLIPTTRTSWQRLSPVPWLGNGKTKQWHDLLKESLRALKSKHYSKVLELAQTMEELDQRTSPTSQRLLATAHFGLGQAGEAAKHCQQEVDVDCALERNSFLSPGIQSNVKTIIEERAKRDGFKCINLQTVFTEYSNAATDPIDLFVDYCHLSIEGMHVAMSSVAAEISTDFSNWNEVIKNIKPLTVDPKYIARGLFEATIYTSHMQHSLDENSSKSNLRQCFRHALSLWEGLEQTMTQYVRMRHGAVVTEVSQDAHQIVASANSLLDYGILQWIHGVDTQTIEAICGALDDEGCDGKTLLTYYQEYDKRKLKEGVDITNPRYLKYFGRDGEVDWDPERGTYRTQPYLRAYWPQLPLVFVADKNTHLDCCLISRLPVDGGKERQGSIKITVNGRFITELAVTHFWSRGHFRIEANFLSEGFNDIEIQWPDLPKDDSPAIKSAVRKLQVFGRSAWYPVFGEVYSFHIKSSRTATHTIS